MRLRNVKYAKELINSYPSYVVEKPKKHKGEWHEFFGNDNPIELEIGCGKGKFIYEAAEKNPNINYIGIEKFDSVIVRALEKLIVQPLNNIKLIRFDAVNITEIFGQNEVRNIYLNFSDPWPKRRHEKRRLTSPRYLSRYHNILQNLGHIYLKTDNYPLFEYSLMQLNNAIHFSVDDVSLDLYKHLPENNIQTEFEIKFVEDNKSIYYLKSIHKGV
ncbi:MAG: tRNA (guanosine(46)-N7)-methyltransferase TrmB [Candidatus Izimaplasma sp.]|nr:tRNA (guanosine(46)-N7)-methyltransferase TrmB [Candidatus Izimaplasma bacterium]